MDMWRDTNHLRGRPTESAYFFSGPPYLQRRESSLSQEDEDEIFEDARETWETEAPITPVDLTNTRGWSGIDTENGRVNNVDTQEKLHSRHSYQEDIAHTPAQPGRTSRRNPSIRRQATAGSEAELDSLTGDQTQPWMQQQQPARPLSMTPSISITSSEGHSRGAEGRPISDANSLANSFAPSVAEEDTSTRYDKNCEVCGKNVRDIWYCNVCKFSFCNACWDTLFLHRQPPRKGRGETPHEKTDPTVAEKVQKVMFPPADDWAREQLYKNDEITSWDGKILQADTLASNSIVNGVFTGIDRPSDFGPPVFQDYGRFAELMANTDPIKTNLGNTFVENMRSLDRDNRTPSLVSFVGQTGAGKSTLVKLLINFSLQQAESYSSPVVGPPGAHLPTSEDVHLYMDPRTADSQGPLLYADCEGLEGGEREPLGAKFRKKRQKDIDEKERALRIISERELRWANGPLERSREFAVTNLYPRLLYTFSDVIVFVLRNPR